MGGVGRGGWGSGRGGGRGGRGHRKEEDNLRRLRVSVAKLARGADGHPHQSEGSDFRDLSRGSSRGLSKSISRGASSRGGSTWGDSSRLSRDPSRGDARALSQDPSGGPAEGGPSGAPHAPVGGLSGGLSRGPSRKEKRKRERALKKSKRQAHFAKFHRNRRGADESSDERGGGGGGAASRESRGKGSSLAKAAGGAKAAPQTRGEDERNAGKRKRIHGADSSGEESDIDDEERATRAGETRKMGLLEANEQEDREIKRLEKLLHMNKKKKKGVGDGAREARLPQAFVLDGLDYILDAVSGRGTLAFYEEGEGGVGEVKRTEEEEKKGLTRLEEVTRKKAAAAARQEMAWNSDGSWSGDDVGLTSDEHGGNDEDDEEDDEEVSGGDEEEVDASEEVEQETGDGKGDDDVVDNVIEEQLSGRDTDSAAGDGDDDDGDDENDLTRSSPAADGAAAGKYVPPQQRVAPREDSAEKREELLRLSKTVKGLVNRLSEANLPWVSGQLEELFLRHSRRDVSSTLTATVLAACVTAAPAPERLLGEHALLISALHHNVGIEIGAAFLEALAKRFDALHRPGGAYGEGKECVNAAALLAQLYLSRVVHCSLVLDVLRRLLGAFTEPDVDAALLLLRCAGTSLRRDDAQGLRELVAEAQRRAAGDDVAAAAGGGERARVRFMLDTMLALKNNDVRKIPGYDPSNLERLRKLLRTLVRSPGSGGGDGEHVLRVSLEQLLSADQAGRWWIVGSSWSGAPTAAGATARGEPKPPAGGEMSAKMMELARKQRMNTDVRRGIFCVVMTSEDYVDAFEKLVRMGLKEQQQREVVHVLVDCCVQERAFNPYYAYLGQKLCQFDRRFKMTFQFSMWDRFKALGNLNTASTDNLVNLLSHLLVHKALPISVFKALEFSEMDKLSVKFLRQVLEKLLLDASDEALPDIFSKVAGVPKLALLREGLKIFMRHFMLRGAAAPADREAAARLRHRIEVAEEALQQKEPKAAANP